MRVATFLSAAAIAVLATAGPAFAYQPATSNPSLSYLTGEAEIPSSDVVKEGTQVAFAIIKKGPNGKYILVKGDNGKKFANCEERANCSYTLIPADFDSFGVYCESAKGCLIVGKS
jgi:hypothetical protein